LKTEIKIWTFFWKKLGFLLESSVTSTYYSASKEKNLKKAKKGRGSFGNSPIGLDLCAN